MRMRGGGDEEDDKEDFYESNDRILSSSCSSTSVSDDESMPASTATTDAADGRSCSRSHRNVAFPSTSSSVYDVWASEPSSVEERRKVLLQRLGLIGDPSLSRPRSVLMSDDDGRTREIERSFTYPRVSSNLSSTTTDGVIPRSRSDPHSQRKHSVARVGSEDGDVDVDKRLALDDYCTIKNLDSGVEFVVKELREDGMWNKLREVGTGKQFTMEEFRNSVIGRSPVVEELMRRQSQEECCKNGNILRSRVKKKRSWFKSIRNMADNVVNGGETRLSSATDDSQDVSSNHGSERVKVRQYGKSWKELTGLYMNQEIHAHSGSIWTIKFSLDGRHLATAGEDCVIHVWKVVESERKRDFMEDMENEGYFNQISTVTNNGSPELIDSEKMRRAKLSDTRKSFSHLAADHVIVPDTLFELSDKPVCSFVGHQEDVLDLSWSKSKLLLSSSMDRTVRLWDMSTDGCLKTFVHSDYVTCIHFNPVDDRYFISGSIDAMVRLWSIEHNQVVDWDDLHEMVTAACYTPNGQGAFVGSHKGDCNFYNISDNKLQEKIQVNLKNKKNKLHMKRITGFQFGLTSSQVLITSADPQIRVIDELDLLLVHKFKGFRNKSSQISASITSDGNHVVCASDSQVYIWRYNVSATPSRNKAHSVTCTRSYEYFHCRGASIAVSWTGGSKSNNMTNSEVSSPSYGTTKAADHQKSMDTRNLFNDRISSTWPEEKLISDAMNKHSFSVGGLLNPNHNKSALGMVIVTAGHGGEIKIFQNFGCPVGI